MGRLHSTLVLLKGEPELTTDFEDVKKLIT